MYLLFNQLNIVKLPSFPSIQNNIYIN